MVAELCGVHQHADVVAGVSSMAWGHFLAGGIAFSASRKIGAPLRTWYWFIGTFAFGKIIWEIEQYRYREGTCPTSALNPVYWFHAGWHVFAAPCGVLLSGVLGGVAAMALWVPARAPLRDAYAPLTQAAAHHAAMRFHGELWVATRRERA